jgi:protein-disulfide isomerase
VGKGIVPVIPLRSFAARLVLGCILCGASAFARDPMDAPTRVGVAGAMSLGDPQAPLTWVEFSDYECAFCQQFHAQVFPLIRRAFVDTGRLRYVVRDFPLPIHRNGVMAARAARCAAEDGRFWEMREILMKGEALNAEVIVENGAAAGFDEERLRSCILSTRHDTAIAQDVREAQAAGVRSTPTFVLGTGDGATVTGTRFAGLQPYEAYAARIRAGLEAQDRKKEDPAGARSEGAR